VYEFHDIEYAFCESDVNGDDEFHVQPHEPDRDDDRVVREPKERGFDPNSEKGQIQSHED
jgi:hypothetical protein